MIERHEPWLMRAKRAECRAEEHGLDLRALGSYRRLLRERGPPEVGPGWSVSSLLDHPTPSISPDLLLQCVLGGACECPCLVNARLAAGSCTFGKCSSSINVYVVESSESTFQIVSIYKVFLSPLGVPGPVQDGGSPHEEKWFIVGGAEHPLVSDHWSPPGRRGLGRRGSRRSLR